MKILYVTHGFPPQRVGGVEVHTEQLARELGGRFDVSVLFPVDDERIPYFQYERDEWNGIRVIRARTRRSGVRFEDLYWNSGVDTMFERLLDEEAPDLVHVQSVIGLSFGILDITRRRGIPTVMSLHDFFSVCPLGQRIRKDLDLCVRLDRDRCEQCLKPALSDAFSGGAGRWPVALARNLAHRLLKAPSAERLDRHDERMRATLGGVDRLVTPSEFQRQQFIDYGIDGDRIRHVSYGFEVERFNGVREARQPSDVVRVGYLGSVIPTKGAHVLLEAFAGIETRNEARLDIHGEVSTFHGDDSYRDSIDRWIGEERGVKIHGRYEYDELPGILAKLDILVVPSIWYETFCITIREGFLAGVPVLASRLGAMGEAIEDGVTGLQFEAGNADDLREKLERLIDDPELRERLARASKTVKAIGENAAELADLYLSLSPR